MDSTAGKAGGVGFIICLALGVGVLMASLNRDKKDEKNHNAQFASAQAQVLDVYRGDYECFAKTGCSDCISGHGLPTCNDLMTQRRIGACQDSSSRCCQESCFRCRYINDDDDDDSFRERRDEDDYINTSYTLSKHLTSELVVYTDEYGETYGSYNRSDFTLTNNGTQLVPCKGKALKHHRQRRERRCDFCGHKSWTCNDDCYCSDTNYNPRCTIINGTCYRPTVRVLYVTNGGERINTTATKDCGMGDINCGNGYIRGINVGGTIQIQYKIDNPREIYLEGAPEHKTSGLVITGIVFAVLFLICACAGCVVCTMYLADNKDELCPDDGCSDCCSCSGCFGSSSSNDSGGCCCFSDDPPRRHSPTQPINHNSPPPKYDGTNDYKPQPGPEPSAPEKSMVDDLPPGNNPYTVPTYPPSSTGGYGPTPAGSYPPPNGTYPPPQGLYPPPQGLYPPGPPQGPGIMPPPPTGVSYPQTARKTIEGANQESYHI